MRRRSIDSKLVCDGGDRVRVDMRHGQFTLPRTLKSCVALDALVSSRGRILPKGRKSQQKSVDSVRTSRLGRSQPNDGIM